MRAYWCCLKAAGRCEHSSALLLYEIIKFTMKKKNVINQNKINPPAGPTWMLQTAGDLVSSDIRILAALILETVAWLQ